MRAIIIGLVVAAVALVGGTVYLLRSYLSQQEATIASMAPKELSIQVLVADADMPAGTAVNGGNVTWQGWPEDGVADGYIVQTKGKDVIAELEKDKSVVRRAISKGEPILRSKLFKKDTPGFLRGSLKPGMRAVAVRSTAETASAGFILPGDKVDVMLTHDLLNKALEQRKLEPNAQTPALETTSETILKDVLVLAVDQKVNEFEGAAVIGKTLLLEVTPKQAELLTTARAMGSLSMVLRSLEDAVDDRDAKAGVGYTTDIEVSPMLSGLDAILAGENAVRASKQQADAPPPAPIARPAPQKKSVKITVYRGSSSPSGGSSAQGTSTK